MLDKSLSVYILIGVGFFYVINSFVLDIQSTNKNTDFSEVTSTDYSAFERIDSVGNTILDVSKVQFSKQLEVWNHSSLKLEWLELFPKFSDMKVFVDDHIVGKPLSRKLIDLVDDAEYKYFSGKLNKEQTQHMLDLLK